MPVNLSIFGACLAPSSCSLDAGLFDKKQRWGEGNGHPNIRATLIGPSRTVPFRSVSSCLGTWQQIVFLELNNRPRKRKVDCPDLGRIAQVTRNSVGNPNRSIWSRPITLRLPCSSTRVKLSIPQVPISLFIGRTIKPL